MDSRRETPLNPITTLAFDWADTVMECGLDHHGPINHLTLIEAVPGVREAILEVQQDYFIVMATNAIEAGVDDINFRRSTPPRCLGTAKTTLPIM